MFFHTFFTFCQAEKSSFRRKNTGAVTAFLKGEKRHGTAIADGSQRQPFGDSTARRLHGRRCPYEGGAGGKAWRESAPLRQPGTAQGWPCGRAGGRAGLAAGRSAGVALRPGCLRGALFGDSKMPHGRRRGIYFSVRLPGGAPEGRLLQRAPETAPAAWAATVCPRAGCKKPGTEKTPGARPNRSLETL